MTQELDIMQGVQPEAAQFYADPNAALREQYDRKDLDDTKVKINERKRMWRRISKPSPTLGALRKSGGDPGWSIEPRPTATQRR
jgi:hypothetical protein